MAGTGEGYGSYIPGNSMSEEEKEKKAKREREEIKEIYKGLVLQSLKKSGSLTLHFSEVKSVDQYGAEYNRPEIMRDCIDELVKDGEAVKTTDEHGSVSLEIKE